MDHDLRSSAGRHGPGPGRRPRPEDLWPGPLAACQPAGPETRTMSLGEPGQPAACLSPEVRSRFEEMDRAIAVAGSGQPPSLWPTAAPGRGPRREWGDGGVPASGPRGRTGALN